ncbi:MAG: DMT family transporter, partial [Candidatus Aminicenantes bacterium]|nr:DMT family transporter [Candidatus Aminicenantes bacterium]
LIIPRFSTREASFLGVLWGLLSGFTFAVLAVYNRKLAQKHPSLLIAFYEDLFATLFLLPFLFFIPISLSVRDLLLLFVLGTLCTAASHSLFIKGMKNIQAQTASLISTLEPVYGIILATIFLQEIPTFRTIAGGVIILVSQIMIAIKFFK